MHFSSGHSATTSVCASGDSKLKLERRGVVSEFLFLLSKVSRTLMEAFCKSLPCSRALCVVVNNSRIAWDVCNFLDFNSQITRDVLLYRFRMLYFPECF